MPPAAGAMQEGEAGVRIPVECPAEKGKWGTRIAWLSAFYAAALPERASSCP